MDQELDWPVDEVELVQELDPQARLDQGGEDLTQRVVPAVLDQALGRGARVGVRAVDLEGERLPM